MIVKPKSASNLSKRLLAKAQNKTASKASILLEAMDGEERFFPTEDDPISTTTSYQPECFTRISVSESNDCDGMGADFPADDFHYDDIGADYDAGDVAAHCVDHVPFAPPKKELEGLQIDEDHLVKAMRKIEKIDIK